VRCIASFYAWLIVFFSCAGTGWGQLSIEAGFPVTELVAGKRPTPQTESVGESLFLVGGHDILQVRLSDLQSTGLHLHLPETRVAACEQFPSGELVVAGVSQLEFGYLAKFSDGVQPPDWYHDDLDAPLTTLAIDQGLCLTGDEKGRVVAFSQDNGQIQWSSSFHTKMVTSLVVLGELNGVRSAASADWLGKIVIFNVATGEEQTNFQQHRDRVLSLQSALNSTPPRLASTGRDGTVRLWYPAQRRLVRFVQLGQPATAMVWLGESTRLAVATRDAKVHVVDSATAEVLSSQPSGLEYIHTMFFAGGSRLIISDGRSRLLAIEIDP
jgi:WD40 repeat protein